MQVAENLKKNSRASVSYAEHMKPGNVQALPNKVPEFPHTNRQRKEARADMIGIFDRRTIESYLDSRGATFMAGSARPEVLLAVPQNSLIPLRASQTALRGPAIAICSVKHFSQPALFTHPHSQIVSPEDYISW